MRVERVLSLLGLPDGPHKPIEVDKAFFEKV
jgi:hypothetical protein